MADYVTGTQALNRMAPSADFTNTARSGVPCKAIYIAKNADGDAFQIWSPVNGEWVNFVTGGDWYPSISDQAIQGLNLTDYTVVYYY